MLVNLAENIAQSLAYRIWYILARHLVSRVKQWADTEINPRIWRRETPELLESGLRHWSRARPSKGYEADRTLHLNSTPGNCKPSLAAGLRAVWDHHPNERMFPLELGGGTAGGRSETREVCLLTQYVGQVEIKLDIHPQGKPYSVWTVKMFSMVVACLNLPSTSGKNNSMGYAGPREVGGAREEGLRK